MGNKMSKICVYLTLHMIDDTVYIHNCIDVSSPPSSPEYQFSPVLSRPYTPLSIVTILSDED